MYASIGRKKNSILIFEKRVRKNTDRVLGIILDFSPEVSFFKIYEPFFFVFYADLKKINSRNILLSANRRKIYEEKELFLNERNRIQGISLIHQISSMKAFEILLSLQPEMIFLEAKFFLRFCDLREFLGYFLTNSVLSVFPQILYKLEFYIFSLLTHDSRIQNQRKFIED